MQVQAYVQQHVGELLQPVAAAISRAKAQQHSSSLQEFSQAEAAAALELALAQAKTICSLAGQQSLNQQAAAVLSISHAPQELAQITQQAGLQLTTAQLVAAARLRVAGLESWVIEQYCEGLDPLVLAALSRTKVGASPVGATCVRCRIPAMMMLQLEILHRQAVHVRAVVLDIHIGASVI
jgi:hypothetical protein